MKALSRLVFVAGAVAIGSFLLRAMPRDVTLVYGLEGVAAHALEVDIDRGGETLRHAEFRFGSGAPPVVSHRVRLADGDYVVNVTVATGTTARHVARPITVSESGTIVIPLGS